MGVLEWYGFGFPYYVFYLSTCPSQEFGEHMFTKQLLFFYEFYVNKRNLLLSYNIYKFYFITAPWLFNSVCTKIHYLLLQKRIIIVSLLYHMFRYFHNICLTSVHNIRTLTSQQIILICRGLNFSKLNLSRLYILNSTYWKTATVYKFQYFIKVNMMK